jgi:hypothetical protein
LSRSSGSQNELFVVDEALCVSQRAIVSSRHINLFRMRGELGRPPVMTLTLVALRSSLQVVTAYAAMLGVAK